MFVLKQDPLTSQAPHPELLDLEHFAPANDVKEALVRDGKDMDQDRSTRSSQVLQGTQIFSWLGLFALS